MFLICEFFYPCEKRFYFSYSFKPTYYFIPSDMKTRPWKRLRLSVLPKKNSNENGSAYDNDSWSSTNACLSDLRTKKSKWTLLKKFVRCHILPHFTHSSPKLCKAEISFSWLKYFCRGNCIRAAGITWLCHNLFPSLWRRLRGMNDLWFNHRAITFWRLWALRKIQF